MNLAFPLAASVAIIAGLTGPLSAEELSADQQQKIRALFNEAKSHYQKKDHHKSIEMCKQALELVPKDDEFDEVRMQGHFFIAANYSLLKEESEALKHLEKAVDFGLTEMTAVERNNDFASLRRSKGYSSLPERMRKRSEVERRQQMEKLKGFDFSLVDLDGKPLRKKDFLGQVLIVDIWGTWCPPCRKEVPHFIDLYKRYSGKGLRIVGLNSEQTKDAREAEKRVKQFISEAKIPYPCALVTDQILKSVPGFSAYPTTIFFGRDGVPRTMEVGARDLDALEAIVKTLLAEATPAAGEPARDAPAGSPSGAAKTDGSPPGGPAK